jgi:osmoprotectant transport system substrate-binding protein
MRHEPANAESRIIRSFDGLRRSSVLNASVAEKIAGRSRPIRPRLHSLPSLIIVLTSAPMRRWLPLLLAITFSCGGGSKQPLVVGSKNFTESVLLGEIVAQRLEASGAQVERRLNMGGTFVCDSAITSGALDTYIEYSGTALTAILKQPIPTDPAKVDPAVQEQYRKRNLVWGPALGFNNTFAMIVRQSDAQKLALHTISDLVRVEDRFRPGFGYEFAARPDGWNGLLHAYGLNFSNSPRTMDLGLTYKAVAGGDVDLIAGNSTDGLIASLGLVVLVDDRHYFPPYAATIVSRRDLDRKFPGVSAALGKLAHAIDDATMRRLNYEVDGKKRDVAVVAREFLATLGR